MNIVIFSDCFLPTINGVSTSIFSLVSYLGSCGHKVMLCVPKVNWLPCEYSDNVKNNQNVSFESDNIKIAHFTSCTFPLLKDNRISFPGPFSLWTDLKKFAPEVIHIQTPGSAGLMGLIFAKLNNIPTVFTHHSLFDEYLHYVPVPCFLTKPLVLFWCKLFWNSSKAVVAPSQAIALQIASQGLTKPCAVIPTGLDLSLFQNPNSSTVLPEITDIIKEKFNLRDKEIPSKVTDHNLTCANNMQNVCQPINGRIPNLLLYVGRVAEEKSIDYLLKVLKKLLSVNPNYFLLIIGDGPYKNKLQLLAEKMGLGFNTAFLGWRPCNVLKHYYAAASLFIFASRTETQGLVLLEAQACGCPVCAVKARGVTESVKDGYSGALVDYGDIDAFSSSVEKIIKSNEITGSFSADATRFSREFSKEIMFEKMGNLYGGIA